MKSESRGWSFCLFAFTLSSHSSSIEPCASGEALGPAVGPVRSQPVCAWHTLAMVTSPAVGMWPRLANQIEGKG